MKGKIAPAARAKFSTLFVALQKGDATPDMLKLAVSSLPKSTLLEPVSAELNPVDPPKEKADKTKAARKRSLLAATPAGRAVLAEKEKEAAK
ncbi:hypothetical protein EON80_08645 [bacterium]|nr:MAG: hypothetical protein EON80_08645 [bacterium]